jgi:hypothetical protein
LQGSRQDRPATAKIFACAVPQSGRFDVSRLIVASGFDAEKAKTAKP